MAKTHNPVDFLRKLVKRRNRELAFDAAMRATLGTGFFLLTLGFIFWFGWFVGTWQVGLILTGIFFLAATWSAWQRVDPMAGLRPLTDAEMLLTLISLASPSMLYFSPRHASAGAAYILIRGPAHVFEALGIWMHRLDANESLLAEAAEVLASCQTGLPAERLSSPSAALLLKRLALIKVVPSGDSSAFVLTEKGATVLLGKKSRKRPQAAG